MNDGKETLSDRYGNQVAAEDREMDLDQLDWNCELCKEYKNDAVAMKLPWDNNDMPLYLWDLYEITIEMLLELGWGNQELPDEWNEPIAEAMQIVEALQTAETKRQLYGRGEKDREIIQAVAAVLQKEERRFMKLLAEVPQDLLRYVEVMERVGALTKNASGR